MIVTRAITDNEQDLLVGFEQLPLLVTCTGGTLISKTEPPAGGWTHETLEDADYPEDEAWDAYLGTTLHWIGSSEV